MSGFKSALGIAMGLTLLLGQTAQAQSNYPNRAIHIVVPYPAGGIVDIIARAVTEQVGRDWKQTVVVEARPGGNSNIGTAAVARSDPDGYIWLVTGPAALVNPTLYKDAGWDAMKGLKCVGLAIWNQSVAVVNPSLPVKTLGEFVELARNKPGQLNFGNAGVGSSLDLTAQKLFQAANIKLTNVGYKGQPPALIDLMTDLMNFEIVSLALALPHIKEGKIRPLAVFTENRIADLPDVPTIAEAGYPGASYVSWYGIYVPAGTPDAIAEKINDGINKALLNPDVQRQLSIADIPGKPMSLGELAALMKIDHDRLTAVVKASGMTPQ
ncbi:MULTISPECIES: Bug family tripartite tricarboxylate transporter substrate binding protein [Bradyrhizobium]|uniref:Tripartite-type tricarboxylate transporter, receptor component TctC n=2 Tax=Bradyrhizobium TaxID=374 RepID=A0ABY0PEW3_9BRAD|nr:MULTISPECIES: tripartite tricarboxylate transporter substrate binding protein [Bradyrhizobium]SDH93079.1 Tripartite-type tricarboxylate transporter, receptor component TctC [Bradyrhizobium ottawaense]SED94509.1 Tripartite-type tricarboxylate transporter, receptor component TctC [Bradyrhizobium lablabi]